MTEPVTTRPGKNPEEISASVDAVFRDISRLNLKLFYIARHNLESFISANIDLLDLMAKEAHKEYDLFKDINKDFRVFLHKEITEWGHPGR